MNSPRTKIHSPFSFLKRGLSVMVLGMLVLSCVESPSKKVRAQKSATDDPSSTTSTDQSSEAAREALSSRVTFESTLSFMDHLGTFYNSDLSLDRNFGGPLSLRGRYIHEYLSVSSNRQKNFCLLVPFPTSGTQNLLLLSAQVKSKFYEADKSLEYFFTVNMGDGSLNTTLCPSDQTELDTLVASIGPLASKTVLPTTVKAAFTFNSVDPSAFVSFQSAPFLLIEKAPASQSNTGFFYSFLGSQQSFQVVGPIDLSNLSLIHVSSPSSSSGGTTNVNSCQDDSYCESVNLDCCQNNVCVKDKSLKSTLTAQDMTTEAFSQAQRDIAASAENIFNYPQFYNICTNRDSADDEDDEDENEGSSSDSAASDGAIQVENEQRLEKLKELYECTTPRDDISEEALCTEVFSSPHLNFNVTDFFGVDASDLSFSETYSGTLSLLNRSVVEVRYNGQLLYKDGANFNTQNYQVVLNSVDPEPVSVGQRVTINQITSQLPDRPELASLKVKYKIDGSCVLIASTLAECSKTYFQGQNIGRSSDHRSGDHNFTLPGYADKTRPIEVTVDGVKVFRSTDWTLEEGIPNYIAFDRTRFEIFEGQKVLIKYFVRTNLFPIMSAKIKALEEIKTICQCGELNCLLEPVELKNSAGVSEVVNYECAYPDPPNTNTLPYERSFFVSTKTAPVLLFDSAGIYQEKVEDSTLSQEGNLFEYKEGNASLPNNVEKDTAGAYKDIGFNEIYGSITFGLTSAQQALRVEVTEGKNYDLFVNQGNFSTCLSCGSDYYNPVIKFLPSNFHFKGGGYIPDIERTDAFGVNPARNINLNKDDFIFGRACFVPATMIPWSHRPINDLGLQRKSRRAAQHFLFANGYQRDWYGFDYGSLIGSFDGEKWFSIGNHRRFKAEGSYLFLAMNAYFSDLTLKSDLNITLSESSTILHSGSMALFNDDSDGAECRKYHYCERDRDCQAQLGPDYSCQRVDDYKTKWPRFNQGALELSSRENNPLLKDLFGLQNSEGTATQKRCVYRGRGAPCAQSFIASSDKSYAGTNRLRTLACNANYHCHSFLDSQGDFEAKFNRRISRFAVPSQTVNASSELDDDLVGDTFGMATKLLGRPLFYEGSETVPADVLSNLSYNHISALCLPGRDADPTLSFEDAHKKTPISAYKGDKLLSLGMTSASDFDGHLLVTCPVLNEEGDYYFLDKGENNISDLSDPMGNDTSVDKLAISQMATTNLLKVFQAEIPDFLQEPASSRIDTFKYEENRCLKLPGSACLTSQECAPSSFLADQVNLYIDDENFPVISSAELSFWKEELVCSQSEKPFNVDGTANEEFKLSNNRCCRETNKEMQIDMNERKKLSSGSVSETLEDLQIAGIDIEMNANTRYTRFQMVHKKVVGVEDYPSYQSPIVDSCPSSSTTHSDCTSFERAQFKTLNEMAARSCCSENWVRNFHEENGGGHTFTADKMQTVDYANFKCLAWSPCDEILTSTPSATLGDGLCDGTYNFDADTFTCKNPGDPNCPARAMLLNEQVELSRALSNLELLGIPQVVMEAVHSGSSGGLLCRVHPVTGKALTSNNPSPVEGTLKVTNSDNPGEYIGDNGGVNQLMVSAGDMSNFHEDLKPIFSKNSFSCCIPSGVDVDASVTNDMCCTGLVNQGRCCLNDYTNLSVYFNRYVSSEAKDISDDLVDPLTGRLPYQVVERLALDRGTCCSGAVARGRFVSLQNIPTSNEEAEPEQLFRALYRSTDSGVDFYEEGLRWNDDVYCVPAGTAGATTQTASGPAGGTTTTTGNGGSAGSAAAGGAQ